MPSSASTAAVSACFALAAPSLTRALLVRAREETLALLGSQAPLPPVLVEEVLAGGDEELITRLHSGAHYRPALFDRLAAVGDPDMAVALYGSGNHVEPSILQREKIWAGARATADRPEWRAPGGLVARLLGDGFAQPGRAELSSPFPELVEAALKGARFSSVTRLRACRWALEYGGLPALRSIAGSCSLGSGVSEHVREACASAEPEKALDAAIRRFEVIPEKMAERRSGPQHPPGGGHESGEEHPAGTPQERAVHDGAAPAHATDTRPATDTGEAPVTAESPAAPAPLPADRLPEKPSDGHGRQEAPAVEPPAEPGAPDWEALLAQHRARPLTTSELRHLWRRADCPEEFALEAFADFARDGRSKGLRLPAEIGSMVFPADRVLDETGPAGDVLEALPHTDERVRTALAARVRRLGSGFAAWRALYTLLPRFKGSVTALVDAALAKAPGQHGEGWPKPLAAEFPRRSTVSLGRSAWLHLYDRADIATQQALTPHLEGRTLQHLLVQHDPSPELRDHLVRTRGASVLACMASHWRTPAEVIEQLIAYDDPEVNAALFLYTDLTDAQRRHILSGRRQKGGDAEDRLDLTPELLKGLGESARRTWMMPICESGDPRLCRILLGSTRVKVHTDAQNLLMLIRLWERHGPQEVRALLDETHFPPRKRGRHPLPAHVMVAAREALDSPDGLAGLRGARAAALRPAALAAFLRTRDYPVEHPSGPDALKRALDFWAEENGPDPMPWPELVAEQHAQPLPDRLLTKLAELPGCPPELAAAAVDARLRLTHPAYTGRSSRQYTPRELLREWAPRAAGRWPVGDPGVRGGEDHLGRGASARLPCAGERVRSRGAVREGARGAVRGEGRGRRPWGRCRRPAGE